ncbi:MAG: hypothetical protein WBB47_15055 [Paenisporosarcina sp.]
MSFQPKDALKQLRKEFQDEGKEIDGKLFTLLEEYVVSANPNSLEESQERVGEFLKYVEDREEAPK